MSVENIISSFERTSRLGTVRSLLGPHAQAQNCAVIESVYQERGHVPPHYHNCEQVLVCAEGDGILFIGEEPHTLLAGSTMVIPAGIAHCFYNTGNGRMRLLSFFPAANPECHWVASLRRVTDPSAAFCAMA